MESSKHLGKIVLKTGMSEIGLRFDFLSGWIEIVKIPNPPQPDEEMHELDSGLDLYQQDT